MQFKWQPMSSRVFWCLQVNQMYSDVSTWSWCLMMSPRDPDIHWCLHVILMTTDVSSYFWCLLISSLTSGICCFHWCFISAELPEMSYFIFSGMSGFRMSFHFWDVRIFQQFNLIHVSLYIRFIARGRMFIWCHASLQLGSIVSRFQTFTFWCLPCSLMKRGGKVILMKTLM